jgi:fumarate hydratase class II
MPDSHRIEKDSMGSMQVPADAYHGAQTARAAENFPISGLRFDRRFIAALGLIKWAAADASHSLGVLDDRRRDLLQQAAQEVIDGKLDSHFVLDIFQTGSGTSTNMNANEVIAARANEIATGRRNDVIPTAIHVSAAVALGLELIPALGELQSALDAKAREYDDVIKIGRTHLQDATPIRLGQELSGYAYQAKLSVDRAARAQAALLELPLGGTAVGTGINSHPEFARRAIAVIAKKTGLGFREATNHFEAQAAKDAVIEASGLLRTIAVSLTKIANDIRLLASGPRCGLGELNIPATQPGSSIMPGKVNPVMSEMLMQVAAQTIGNDATIGWAGALGSTFELNVMMPVIAYNLLQSIALLAQGSRVFAKRCIVGLTANRERCESLVEQSLAMCTALAPVIGYDQAAEIAKQSMASGKTVRQVAAERKVLDAATLEKVLDPRRMTNPQPDNLGSGGG